MALQGIAESGKSAAIAANVCSRPPLRRLLILMIIYRHPVNHLPNTTFHLGETAGDRQVMVFKAATFHGIAPAIESENAMRSALECEVANALAVAGGLDASDVTVTAVGQEIRLGGTVATLGEMKRASAVAEAMAGVRLVRNRILVG
jgi:hypothetical protein